MKKYGLIGNPIEHSLSPALFRAGYDGAYPYELIEGSDFKASWQRFLDEYDGINITAPFKENALKEAQIISPEAEAIGACNLAIKTPEGIKAYNSDYYGIILAILSAVCCRGGLILPGGTPLPPRPDHEFCVKTLGGRLQKALVVGAGGAAKAAVAAAAALGLEITLINRTFEKARLLAQNMSSLDITVLPAEELAAAFTDADIVIYTVPGEMERFDSLRLAAERHREEYASKYILEANYRAPVLQNLDCRYIPGQTWLLGQAYAGYDLFTGEVPDIEKMSKIIM